MMNIDDVYDLLVEHEKKLDELIEFLKPNKDREEISEYMKANRSAIILESEQGYEVDLYEYRKCIETKKVHENSYEYASNLAENWINKIF